MVPVTTNQRCSCFSRNLLIKKAGLHGRPDSLRFTTGRVFQRWAPGSPVGVTTVGPLNQPQGTLRSS